MRATSSIYDFLRAAHVPYTVVAHRPAFTARDEAAATHVAARGWAKVVVCFVDGEPIEALVPASFVVDLDRLLELTGGSEIRVAQEAELPRLFPDCEAGAMPPFGGLYRQAVFVDATLAAQPDLVFNAGTHTEAIAMRWADFARTVRPIVGRFAEPQVG